MANNKPHSEATKKKQSIAAKAKHAEKAMLAKAGQAAGLPIERLAHVETRDRWRDYFSNLNPSKIAGFLNTRADGDIKQWIEWCDFMFEQDPHIRACVEKRSHTLAGLDIHIEPRDSSDEAIAAAELARLIFDDIEDRPRSIRRMLQAIYYGPSMHEIVYSDCNRHIGVKALEPVESRRLRIEIIDGCYRPIYYSEDEPGGVDLLLEYPGKFIFHSPGDHIDPMRRGLFRSVSWYFYFKRLGANYWVGGAEKFSFPALMAKIPQNTPDHIVAAIEAYLRNLRSDAVAVFDSRITVDQVSPSSASGGSAIWDALCRFFNDEISKCIVGSTLVMEQGSNGSYGSVVSQMEALGMLIRSDARALEETIRHQLIRPIIEANLDNFGGVMPPLPIVWINTEKRQYQPIQPWHLQIKNFLTYNMLLADMGLPLRPKEEDGFIEVSPAAPPTFSNNGEVAEGSHAPLELSHWMRAIPTRK